ncbi:PEP-utilizing enzyme [Paenibacillus tianjinensis]|uniref:PEP-utilising enzyme mobile domain-containing protein n=1 Tax=Paenibacillus tianjinensis TaxID=2810347 RepID=A0ABX7LK11_9BACL|nr:PEP-utilizing enzyme [Paenibacillus tianjinensis]QSF47354.1 hypothetical protein JRJ22_12730 [Paenibacillus tianjinensis]
MELLLSTPGLDAADVGNKAFNLSRLIFNDFRVPAGMVLPLNFFACTEAELNSRLVDIAQQLAQLLPSADGWAVRSSAADEDSSSQSMAGQYKSTVISHPSVLPSAVTLVHENSIPVIIQIFVEPDYSGVLFSCNPVTGETDLNIEIVEGRGEQLVGGYANPLYSYRNGIWDKSIDFVNQLQPLLQPWVSKAETLFNQPVDMEFCLKNGTLYWLQVRPITTGVQSLDEDWFLLDQCTEPVAPLVMKLDPGGFFQMPYWDTRFVQHYPYIRIKNNSTVNQQVDSPVEWQILKSKYEPEFDKLLSEDISNYSVLKLWEITAERVEINRAYVLEYLDRGWLKARRVIGEKLRGIISRFARDHADVHLILSSLTEALNTLTYQKTSELNRLIRSARMYSDFNELKDAVIAGTSHPWAEEFNAFIHKYGYELPHPLALHLKTLAESTEDILLRIHTELGKYTYRETSVISESWRETAAALEQRMSCEDRAEFRDLLHVFRAMLIRTEDDDYLLQKGASAIRKVLLEVEKRLLASGEIKDTASIFFLYPDEISGIISGSAPSPNEDTLVQRKEAFAAAQQVNPQQKPAARHSVEAPAEGHLQGVAVSRGAVRGKVYKLMNPLDRESYSLIPADAVIVAPVLTPNLTYAIISCAAIVTEVGGFLSHGAIFAREMGIPAIVQVAGVTELLENGDDVLVDAEQGIIQRVISTI